MKLAFCITHDDHFSPMCRHLISNLEECSDEIDLRLNRIQTQDSERNFGSKSWYENLSEKIRFLMHNISMAQEGQTICVSDADIQFFRPKNLLDKFKLMSESDVEYLGQREGGTIDENLGGDFNGGFFLIKKNNRTLEFIKQVCDTDIRKCRLADQEVINQKIKSLGIKANFLEARKYVHGCCIQYEDYVGPGNSENIVMHHATCTRNMQEKMDQMNVVRAKMNFPEIDWNSYA